MPKGIYPRDEETMRKLKSPKSESFKENLRRKRSGNNNPFFGKKHSEETRKKLYGTAWKSGEKHHNWKGGGHRWWRDQVLKRDEWTCQRCGIRDTALSFMDVDHIISRKKAPLLSMEVSNGQTLCPNCHRRKTLENGEYTGWRAGRPKTRST